MTPMIFDEATGRHPRALKVTHDQGLSPRTENMTGSENVHDDEDNEINQVEHEGSGRTKLTLKDLMKRELMFHMKDLLKCQGMSRY